MIGVLGIPYDENSSYLKGPALAPQKIREAFHSDSANYFTESGIDLKNHLMVKDLGDLRFDDKTNFLEHIKGHVAKGLADHEKLFVLGGDHSITYPVIAGFSSLYKPLSILHIDAHPDLYHDFDGNPFSHASPFARIMENGLATRLVQTGIRTLSKHQKEQAELLGVEMIEMKDWDDEQEFHFEGPVYLSLDLDVLDPAFAPGVSHHEPGGLTTRQVVNLLRRLEGNFIGADLVELNPTRDPSGMSNMVAAKLYKEILDLLLRS